MFKLLVKHLINQQQRIFRLQIKTISSGNDNRDTGIVKRFSKDKGFGFIQRNSNGNDIFVHFQSILGTGFKTLEQGQQVKFKVVENVKGLEARVSFQVLAFFNILFVLLDVEVTNPMSDLEDNNVKKFQISTNDRHIGVVRKFTKTRGFGFITRKSDGADFFVHSRSIRNTGLESLNEGMEVEFSEVQSDRGAEAKEVRIVNKTDSIAHNQKEQKEFRTFKETGVVKRWNKERGFGFVRRTLNGKDLFVHARSLKDDIRELEVGQQIQFRIQQTEKGEEACDVYRIEDSTNLASMKE